MLAVIPVVAMDMGRGLLAPPGAERSLTPPLPDIALPGREAVEFSREMPEWRVGLVGRSFTLIITPTPSLSELILFQQTDWVKGAIEIKKKVPAIRVSYPNYSNVLLGWFPKPAI